MRRSLKLVVPGLVCFLSLVVLSVSSVAADGPNTDPIDPPGATEPTSTLTDVVVDVIQTAWGTIWAVIL